MSAVRPTLWRPWPSGSAGLGTPRSTYARNASASSETPMPSHWQNARVRILATTDLHYRLPHYDWLVRAAADVDVVAITGDLADVVNPVPMGVQVVVLEKYLRLIADQATLLVASGNHDLDGPGADGEQVAGWLRRPMTDAVHSDGTSVDIDGTRFTVCPWWDGPI